MDGFWKDTLSIATAIIGVAIIALLVKNASGTAAVIGAATGGFSNALLAAESGGSGGYGSSLQGNYGAGSYGLGTVA